MAKSKKINSGDGRKRMDAKMAEKMIGEEISYDRTGKTISGVCDSEERRPGIWRNAKTGKRISKESIRFRIKPTVGRAVWTGWFPVRNK